MAPHVPMPRVFFNTIERFVHEACNNVAEPLAFMHVHGCLHPMVAWAITMPLCSLYPELYLELAVETFVRGIYSSQEARHTWAATRVIQLGYP
jgi:hypothetical protein